MATNIKDMNGSNSISFPDVGLNIAVVVAESHPNMYSSVTLAAISRHKMILV